MAMPGSAAAPKSAGAQLPAHEARTSTDLLAENASLHAQVAALRAEMHHLAYTVSHDLRAPLRHIVSFSKVVQDEGAAQLDPELQDFLGMVVDSAKHMGVLLEGLLALSRVGTADMLMASVSLSDVLLEVQLQLARQYPQANVEWVVAPDLPTVWGDAALLRTVLTHVLDNAVKFSVGANPQTVEVGWSRVQGSAGAPKVALTIQDQGVGFDAAHQAKLFQVFGRLPEAKGFAGIGIGLAIARKALERMGGGMALQAPASGGCLATLQLVEPR